MVRIRCTDANIKPTFETPIQKGDEDTIENRLKPEVPAILTCNPIKAISQFRISKEVKENGYLSICVYACVAFAYMQLVILVVALNVSSTPPGLIFLSLSLSFIGYVVFKVGVQFCYKFFFLFISIWWYIQSTAADSTIDV